MKRSILTSITALSALALFTIGCASSNEMADNTGMEPTEVVVTETETAVYTAPQSDAALVVTETDVVADTTIMTADRENVANTVVRYNEMFEDLDDTEQYDILTLAKSSPNLSTFVELVELSGLAPSFKVAEALTVFAPTNDAFNKMPQERLARLIDPQYRNELVEFIQMHSLPSEVTTLQLNEQSYIDRGEQEDIPVSLELAGTIVYVGGAPIVKGDVEASNGVLHVVDGIFDTTETAGADID